MKHFAHLWKIVDFIVPLLYFRPVAQHRVHAQSAFLGWGGKQVYLLVFLFIHHRKTTVFKQTTLQHQSKFPVISFSHWQTFLFFHNERCLSLISSRRIWFFLYIHSDKRIGMQTGLLFILSTSGFRVNLMMLLIPHDLAHHSRMIFLGCYHMIWGGVDGFPAPFLHTLNNRSGSWRPHLEKSLAMPTAQLSNKRPWCLVAHRASTYTRLSPLVARYAPSLLVPPYRRPLPSLAPRRFSCLDISTRAPPC